MGAARGRARAGRGRGGRRTHPAARPAGGRVAAGVGVPQHRRRLRLRAVGHQRRVLARDRSIGAALAPRSVVRDPAEGSTVAKQTDGTAVVDLDRPRDDRIGDLGAVARERLRLGDGPSTASGASLGAEYRFGSHDAADAWLDRLRGEVTPVTLAAQGPVGIGLPDGVREVSKPARLRRPRRPRSPRRRAGRPRRADRPRRRVRPGRAARQRPGRRTPGGTTLRLDADGRSTTTGTLAPPRSTGEQPAAYGWRLGVDGPVTWSVQAGRRSPAGHPAGAGDRGRAAGRQVPRGHQPAGHRPRRRWHRARARGGRHRGRRRRAAHRDRRARPAHAHQPSGLRPRVRARRSRRRPAPGRSRTGAGEAHEAADHEAEGVEAEGVEAEGVEAAGRASAHAGAGRRRCRERGSAGARRPVRGRRRGRPGHHPHARSSQHHHHDHRDHRRRDDGQRPGVRTTGDHVDAGTQSGPRRPGQQARRPVRVHGVTGRRLVLGAALLGLLPLAACGTGDQPASASATPSATPSATATPSSSVSTPPVPAGWTPVRQDDLVLALPPGFAPVAAGAACPVRPPSGPVPTRSSRCRRRSRCSARPAGSGRSTSAPTC
nr:hypothetical protein [Angustibacter aerolatus]